MLTDLHAYDLSSLFACDRCGAGILNFIIFGQNILWTEHSYLAAAIKMDLVRPFLVENIFCGGWNRTELSFAICSEVSEIWKGRSEFETLCRKNWGQKRAYFRVVYNKIVTSLWVSSERNALDYWKNTFKLLGSLYYPKFGELIAHKWLRLHCIFWPNLCSLRMVRRVAIKYTTASHCCMSGLYLICYRLNDPLWCNCGFGNISCGIYEINCYRLLVFALCLMSNGLLDFFKELILCETNNWSHNVYRCFMFAARSVLCIMHNAHTASMMSSH